MRKRRAGLPLSRERGRGAGEEEVLWEWGEIDDE